MLLQDVDIPEQVETPEPAAQVASSAAPAHQPDGGASGPPAARKELADGKMTTRSAPYAGEEEAATNDAALTMAAEDSDAAFRRAQSDTELVRVTLTLTSTLTLNLIVTLTLTLLPRPKCQPSMPHEPDASWRCGTG